MRKPTFPRTIIVSICLVVLGCEEAPVPLGGKVDHWVQALNDPDAKIRKQAVFKLGNIGSSEAAVIPALIGGLKDRDARVRCESVLALLKSGQDAVVAIEPLREVQQRDRDSKVREYAAKAVARLTRELTADGVNR